MELDNLNLSAAVEELTAEPRPEVPIQIQSSHEQPFPDTGEYDEAREKHVRTEIGKWAAYAERGTAFDPTGKYLCGTCHERLEPDSCMWVSGKIDMDCGSCRLYVHGPDQQATKRAPQQLTQIESQYAERPETHGFGCSRCEYGSEAKKSDSGGRKSWCSFWGLHVIPNACCAMEDGEDMIDAPGEEKDIRANYKLEGRTEFRGLQISIETDKGSTREGTDKSGKPWKVTMTRPYGYIRMTEGVDGDHVDCFLGDNEAAENVYVIHTKEPTNGHYDEDKCMLGFDSPEEAKKVFLENYSDPGFFGSMDTIPFEKFKAKVLETKDDPKKLQAYGTSEGVEKSWDTRGRGRKEEHTGQRLILAPEAPSKDKPIALVFGGSFNPSHTGHAGAAVDAARLLTEAGYKVGKVIVAPTADKLIKVKLGEKMYPLQERTELAKRTFPSDMEVTSKPGEEAETQEGKLRRTQLADWVQKQYPDYTAVNVTGDDDAPGHPPGYPSLYEGDKGSHHEGYYYLAVHRTSGGESSTHIRQQIHEGKQPEGMTSEAYDYLKTMLTRHPEIKADLDINAAVAELLNYGTSEGVAKAWDTRGRGRKEEERDKQIWRLPLYRGTTTRRLEDILKEGMTPAKSSFNVAAPAIGTVAPEHGAVYATYQRKIAEHYAMLKKNYNETEPGHKFMSSGVVWEKPKGAPAAVKGTKPVIVKMEVPIGLMKKFRDDPESPAEHDSYIYRGTIPKEYISGVEVYDKGKWSNYDWKKKVAAAGDEQTSILYFILDDIKDLQKHDMKAESLFHNMRILGFTGPEEEFVRATASRVPPELMVYVKRIICAPWLKAKHGRYVPETGTIFLNPKNVTARARVGEGPGWIQHGELTTIHEIGHSVYDNLPEDVKDRWMELSGWMVGTKPGQDEAYVEKRSGWEPGESKWTHRKGIKFPRIYSEKNPDENFADDFAYYLMNKAHQIDSKQKEFLDELFEEMVRSYPKYSVESPDKPYGEAHLKWAMKGSGTSEGAEKGWDTRGRGKKEPIDYLTEHGVHVGIFDRPESGQEAGTIPIENIFNHPPPPEEERKKIADEFNGAVKVGEKEFDINDIIPMQKTLTEARLARWRSREERGLNPRSPAAVFHKGDNYYLMDGHHRIGDEIMKGTKTLKMTEFALPRHVSAELDIAAAMNELLAASKPWWNPELQMGVEDIEAYGTSEGVTKSWDTRGRGRKESIPNLVSGVRMGTFEDAKTLGDWAKMEQPTIDSRFEAGKRIALTTAGYFFENGGKHGDTFVATSDKNGMVGAMVINHRSSLAGRWDKSAPVEVRYLVTNPRVISGEVKERGVGTKLMIQAAKIAAEKKVGLELIAADEAMGFYEKLGMHKEGKYGYSWTPQETEAFAKWEQKKPN